MYVIAYFDRKKGKGVERRFPTHFAAAKKAQEIFEKTGIIVGIEERKSK